MKLLITLFCCTALSLSAADKINIDSVPWTDACYFWSMEGKRLPVFNKNLMGNKLSIGGVKYDRGIAGHTPFSVVYNLSGEALSFSALVGVDDEAHPRDPENLKSASVEIQIIIDREIVKRLTVALGQKAVPIKVDLRGKQQIELRGTFKTGFKKQRVDFVNAYFKVKNKKNFLEIAVQWQQKVKSQLFRKINYPAAPKWQNLKIKKVKYRNWNNAYELSNNKCSLIVVPECGGRVLNFALKSKENFLFQGQDPADKNCYKRGIDIVGGGNFSRLQPHIYFNSSDPILAYGQYSVTFPSEGEIIMTSGFSWYFGIQFIYRIKLHPDVAKMTITTVHKNIASYSHKAGIWSITRIITQTVAALFMPKEIQNPYKKSIFNSKELFKLVEHEKDSNFNKLTLDFKIPATRRWYVEWQNFPAINKIKVLLRDNTFFIKTFDYQKSMNPFMPKFYPAHFYLCRTFIEAETHGPTKVLEPGKTISWRENWELKKKY